MSPANRLVDEVALRVGDDTRQLEHRKEARHVGARHRRLQAGVDGAELLRQVGFEDGYVSAFEAKLPVVEEHARGDVEPFRTQPLHRRDARRVGELRRGVVQGGWEEYFSPRRLASIRGVMFHFHSSFPAFRMSTNTHNITKNYNVDCLD